MVSNIHLLSAKALIPFIPCLAQAQQTSLTSPRGQLDQYVTQLQANPSDDALRTKIIQLALTLDPKPAVSEGAAVADGKAKTIFSHASSPDDLKAAAAAFAQASLLAPWVPDYYFNAGAALEKANQYDDAIRALNFYLLAAPNAPDAGDVRGRIEGINYEKEKVVQEASDKAAREQEDELRRARMFAGSWYSSDGCFIKVSYLAGVYDVRDCSSSEATPVDGGGGRIMQTRISTVDRFNIADRRLSFRLSISLHMYGGGTNRTFTQANDYDLVISDDGQHLNGQWAESSNSQNSRHFELYRH